jgi:putative dehydrogenase
VVRPIVSIMAQGSMGAATGGRLVENGVEVRTVLAGRSAASAERAGKAGMKPVSWEDLVQADFLLSIVPPAEAIPLARQLAPLLRQSARKPIYVDLNAINPATATAVEMIVAPTECRFVDGGIIGGPPRAGYAGPVYYVSGDDAAEVNTLSAFGLKVGVIDAPVGAASALKMSYAGITKGLTAIGASMILAAHRAGVSAALFAELSASQANLLGGLSRSIPDMFSKADRWVAEMHEIAGFVGEGVAEHQLYEAMAALYRRLGDDFAKEGAEIAELESFFSAKTVA